MRVVLDSRNRVLNLSDCVLVGSGVVYLDGAEIDVGRAARGRPDGNRATGVHATGQRGALDRSHLERKLITLTQEETKLKKRFCW